MLPLLLSLMIFFGFYTHTDKLSALPGWGIWMAFSGAILNVMGSLLLPMLVVFITYSVNNVEHKSDTWKTIFSLPLPKWSVYTSP